MRQCRIIERIDIDGRHEYVIQKKLWIFGWRWCDAANWTNTYKSDTYKTIEDARRNLCHFDGSKPREFVIEEAPSRDIITTQNKPNVTPGGRGFKITINKK